jgi:hypothetical protein
MQWDSRLFMGPGRKWWRAGGAAGIVFIILFIVGNAITGEAPTWDDPIEEIRAYFSEDDDAYLIGDYLNGLAFVSGFLIYLVHLRSLLAAGEGSPAIWSRLALIGGVLCVLMGAAGSLFWGALAFGGAEGLDDSTLQAFMYADAYGFSLLSFGIAVFIGAASLVVIGSGILWRWIGWFGLVVAVVSLIAPLYVLEGDNDSALGTLGFISFLGFAFWVFASSVSMLMLTSLPAGAADPAEA